MQPPSLTGPPRTRPAEPWRDRDHGRARPVVHDFELAALAHCGLMDVTAEDQLRAGPYERSEYAAPLRDRELACRTPRRADQVMVEDGHAQSSRIGGGQPFRRARELRRAQRAALMAKRARRVEADDMQAGH
jgi:hypothetical protein